MLIENIAEYAPIVYTPTVGLVCQNYSGLFRRPRGMFFSAEDRGEMMSMVYNWPAEQVLFFYRTYLYMLLFVVNISYGKLPDCFLFPRSES